MLRLTFIAALSAGLFQVGAAAAEDYWDAGDYPWPFGRHEYGSDMRKPRTPGRPWHGDDAVPLGLRWHDRGWTGSPAEPFPVGEGPPVSE